MQSAPDVSGAQSKTLRGFQGIIVSRTAFWSAAALRRFSLEQYPTVPLLIGTAISAALRLCVEYFATSRKVDTEAESNKYLPHPFPVLGQ
jgi:hypothetical protein